MEQPVTPERHASVSRIAQAGLMVVAQSVAEALAYADRMPRLGARCSC